MTCENLMLCSEGLRKIFYFYEKILCSCLSKEPEIDKLMIVGNRRQRTINDSFVKLRRETLFTPGMNWLNNKNKISNLISKLI